MGSMMRLGTIVFVMAILAGCGGRSAVVSQAVEELSSSNHHHGQKEIDPALLAQLSAELERAMAEHDSLKRVATAPTSEPSKVNDFSIGAGMPGGLSFDWSYRNQGDYDQNGEVNQADLTEIALYFGMTEGQPGWAAAEPADGDGNGEVNLSDIAPIAIWFGNTVNGYSLQATKTPENEATWAQMSDIPLVEGVLPEVGGFKEFTSLLVDAPFENYLRVVPYFGDSENSPEFGIPSNTVFVPDTRGNWSMLGGDAQRTGRSPFVGSQTNNVKWKFHTTGAWFTPTGPGLEGSDGTTYVGWGSELLALNPDGSVKWRSEGCRPSTGVVMAEDGTLYVGSQVRGLSAINPDGSVKWTDVAGSSNSTPTIGADGTIYLAGLDTNLYAINPNGTEKWAQTMPEKLNTSPAIGADGTIYVGGQGSLFSLSPDGTELWSFLTGGEVFDPVIGDDETVYFGSMDGYLYAINPDSTEKWRYLTGVSFDYLPAIGADGKVFSGGANGKVLSILPDGTLSWSYETGGLFVSTLVVGANGSIFIGGNDQLLSFDQDGNLLWSVDSMISTPYRISIALDGAIHFSTYGTFNSVTPEGEYVWSVTNGGEVYSSPAISPDGTIYFGSWDRRVYAITPDGALKWFYEIDERIMSSPAIGLDGTVYIGNEGNLLYSFFPNGELNWEIPLETNCLDNSPLITPEEMILITGRDTPDRLYSINLGNLRKSYFPATNQSTIWPNLGSPSLSLDGTAYYCSSNGELFACLINRGLKWKTAKGLVCMYSTPSISDDGTLYLGGSDQNLLAINPDGTEKWTFTSNAAVGATAIGSDGTVYITSGSNLIAIYPDGTEKWSYNDIGLSISSPAIDVEGNVYVGDNDGLITAINSEGHPLWSYQTHGVVRSSPAIGSDGTVYVGSADGYLYAFGD